jgi:CemA family
MASAFGSGQHHLLEKLREYVHAASDRFLKTPERSLDQAYQAALKIASIEDKYFKEGNKPTALANSEGHVEAFLRTEVDRNLAIAKVRLTEFKASSLVFESLSSNQMEKLTFVDFVLAKYVPKELPSPEAGTSLGEVSPSALVSSSSTSIASSSSATSPLSPTVDTSTESIVEKAGLLPRSIARAINRIKEELDPESEEEVIKRFRDSRTKTTIAARFLLSLIIVPLLAQQLSKNFIISPIVDRVREHTTQVFLNYEMEEEAFQELRMFEENFKFESLTSARPPLSEEQREELVKHKAVELAEEFHEKSNNAVSNVFADMIALGAFVLTLFMRRNEIAVLQSFMDTLVYGLSDSAKAFIIILSTDIFVGFHSPHGWEVLLEGLANHLGVAANHSMISLFIATVPVVADTILKYWIFRYLSQMSPSTVATLKEMDE